MILGLDYGQEHDGDNTGDRSCEYGGDQDSSTVLISLLPGEFPFEKSYDESSSNDSRENPWDDEYIFGHTVSSFSKASAIWSKVRPSSFMDDTVTRRPGIMGSSTSTSLI